MSGSTYEKRNKMVTLFELQKGDCPYCRQPLMHPRYVFENGLSREEAAPTLEHVIPKSRGGKNALENLLLVHSYCNQERGSRRLPKHATRVRREIYLKVCAWRRDNFKGWPQ